MKFGKKDSAQGTVSSMAKKKKKKKKIIIGVAARIGRCRRGDSIPFEKGRQRQ